jgi:hypothetical protein
VLQDWYEITEKPGCAVVKLVDAFAFARGEPYRGPGRVDFGKMGEERGG